MEVSRSGRSSKQVAQARGAEPQCECDWSLGDWRSAAPYFYNFPFPIFCYPSIQSGLIWLVIITYLLGLDRSPPPIRSSPCGRAGRGRGKGIKRRRRRSPTPNAFPLPPSGCSILFLPRLRLSSTNGLPPTPTTIVDCPAVFLQRFQRIDRFDSMAGWTNSTTGTGSGGGRGSGGRGFTNRLYTNNSIDLIHGGTSGGGGGGGSGRFIRGRSRGRPPQQPHYRYRRVDAVHRDSPPATLSDQQAASSSSSRHARLTHPISTADKSSASGTAAPLSTREPDDKAIRNAANFECNVCFDIAAEPVVTKCGHLFCWECLYQWLHVHSHHRECPVCKGQVADDAIIPIYGRGGSAASVNNAPPRPTGARVESSRQQQTSSYPTLFEFPRIMNLRTSFREAVMSIMPPSLLDTAMDNSDAMTYFDDGEFYPGVNEFDMEVDRYGDLDDEVYEYDDYDFDFGAVPFFGSAGTEASNPSSSQAQADMINIRDSTVGTTTGGYHHQESGYSGARPNNNRGRRGRRNHTRVSADHFLSTDEMVMVMPGSSGFIHNNNNGGSSNVSAGATFQPNGGWTERRGRSNRNSNSGGGRGGMQDRRRQRTHYI